MGLIGNGIYYRPRTGCLTAAGPGGGTPVVRPIHSSVDWRRTWDSDYCSFPSGMYLDALVLPMKVGGIALRVASGSGSASVPVVYGDGQVAASIAGAATANLARLAGTIWMIWQRGGTGAVSVPTIRGTTFVSCDIKIGFQPSATDIAYAVWGLDNGIEAGWTPRQIMRAVSAVLAGKVSGAGANAPVFRDVNDTKARVSATTDADGNRTAVTIDVS